MTIEEYFNSINNLSDVEFTKYFCELVAPQRIFVRVPHANVAQGFVKKMVVKRTIERMQERPVSWEAWESVLGRVSEEDCDDLLH